MKQRRRFRPIKSEPEKPDYKHKPVFELHHGVHAWKIYANGYVEGFPEGTIIVNRIQPLLNYLGKL